MFQKICEGRLRAWGITIQHRLSTSALRAVGPVPFGAGVSRAPHDGELPPPSPPPAGILDLGSAGSGAGAPRCWGVLCTPRWGAASPFSTHRPSSRHNNQNHLQTSPQVPLGVHGREPLVGHSLAYVAEESRMGDGERRKEEGDSGAFLLCKNLSSSHWHQCTQKHPLWYLLDKFCRQEICALCVSFQPS